MTLACYILFIVTAWRYVTGQHANDTDLHGRRERSLGFNFDERRITFPPGSTLILTPTLAIPFIRNLPDGFSSDMTISAPFSMNMDDLGLADEDNPWGVIPGISQTREDSERRRRYQGHRQRFKRSSDSYRPHPLGDRKVVFAAIEDYLYSLGHNGEACLRRAICEFHEHPLPYHGLFGEAIGLLFRVSTAPFADEILEDYITAEKDGREKSVCHHYFKECPISLFSSASDEKHKYRDIDFNGLKKRRDQSRAKFQANHANKIH